MRNLVIRTEKLTKSYGPRRGIENISLQVEPGEVFGLLGAQQAGKSTFLRILLDLVRPTSGDAYVLGMDSRRQSMAIRRRTGYMPSRLVDLPNLTARQLLQHLAEIQGSADWDDARQFAQRLNLDLTKPIDSLPATEIQKINLVQATLNHPELYLLDEPTNGMDEATRQEFLLWVLEKRSEGTSVFIASHSLAVVEKVCDRVGILRDGMLASVERVVQFKSRLLRKVEIRFAEPISLDAFSSIPNLADLSLERTTLRCTLVGDPDRLIKAAGQFHIQDFISRTPRVEDVVRAFYGEGSHAN